MHFGLIVMWFCEAQQDCTKEFLLLNENLAVSIRLKQLKNCGGKEKEPFLSKRWEVKLKQPQVACHPPL